MNGVSQFDGEVSGDKVRTSDLPGFFLNPGDTVDFTVGYGANQNFDNDTTVAISRGHPNQRPDDQTLAVARLTRTGQLDTNFKIGQGFNSIDVGRRRTGQQRSASEPAGRFRATAHLVAGSSDGNFVVSRFNADGTDDFDFGDNGGYTSTSVDDSAQRSTTSRSIPTTTSTPSEAAEGQTDEAPLVGHAKISNFSSDIPTAVLTKFDSNGSLTNEIEYSSGRHRARRLVQRGLVSIPRIESSSPARMARIIWLADTQPTWILTRHSLTARSRPIWPRRIRTFQSTCNCDCAVERQQDHRRRRAVSLIRATQPPWKPRLCTTSAIRAIRSILKPSSTTAISRTPTRAFNSASMASRQRIAPDRISAGRQWKCHHSHE